MTAQRAIRLALPSKGRLAEASLDFLARSGLAVQKLNPRQYVAHLPAIPGLEVLFQRAGDIVVGVRQGSVDFGITGYDMVQEKRGDGDEVLLLHDALGFGHCRLSVAVPEHWTNVHTMAQLADYTQKLGRPLRVATKFPRLTAAFLRQHGIPHQLIALEGTLEIAPTIGIADVIVDLVTTGLTLRDNRLRALEDGVILHSQAVLIANRRALETRADALEVARHLLEYIEAHLRAQENYLVIANVAGTSADDVARRIQAQPHIRGLQGPTISPVYGFDGRQWFSVSIVVARRHLNDAIAELRAIGGSGVIVTPVRYIFEEEPPRLRALLQTLGRHA